MSTKIVVAVYCRVSKLDQKPQNQIIELKDYAKKNNFVIHKVYTDKMSGAKATRPMLNEMLIDARLKKFDAILIWKVDRLGRSTLHMLQIVEELNKLNISLIISTLGIDTRTPIGKLILGFLFQLAEFERELIRERIFLGLKRAKKEGKKLGRPKGSKDHNPRNKSGYYLRWGKQSTPHNLMKFKKENV